MIKKTSIIFLFILIISSQKGFSQNIFCNIEHFSIENGLTQNTVNFVFRDKVGYLWIGTQDGLNSYYGYNFNNYREKPDDNNSISSNHTRSICQDKYGNLWIATTNGLNKYNPETKKFTRYFKEENNPNSLYDNDLYFVFYDNSGILRIKTKRGLSSFNIETNTFSYFEHENNDSVHGSDYNRYPICEDKDGNLWIASKEGIMNFNKITNKFSVYRFSSIISENEVISLLTKVNNEIIIGTRDGIKIFNLINHTFTSIRFAITEVPKEQKVINTIFRDFRGRVWLGTNDGLSIYNETKKVVEHFEIRDNNNNKIKPGRVSSIIQDQSEILWISTQNGVFKIDLKKPKFQLYRKGNGEIPAFSDDRIFSIHEYNDSILWLGTRQSGLNIFNRNTNEVTIYSTESKNKIPDNSIHSIYKDSKQRMWIGTENGIFIYDDNLKVFNEFGEIFNVNCHNLFKNNRISNIIEDKNGNFWFATYNGLLFFDGKTVVNSYTSHIDELSGYNKVIRVFEDNQGRIWTTSLQGLIRYDPETKKIKHFVQKINQLSNKSVLSVNQSKNGTIWVGSVTGVNRYNENLDLFDYFTSEANKFSNDYIYGILEDENEQLWMSTNKGIVCFNPASKEVSNYSIEDGLQGYEFNIGSYFKSKSGEMFFGGTNGFNSFYPDSIINNQYSPKTLITKFEKSVNGEYIEIEIPDNKVIELSYKEQSFRIEFTIPEYTHPNKNTYEYSLKNIHDDSQSYITQNNTATFPQIPPGEYEFTVLGANSDGVKSEESVTLYISISPPWWWSKIAITFYSLFGFIILVLISLYYRNNLRNANKRADEKEKINTEIELQKKELKQKEEERTDSIQYARRIIDALMPGENHLKRILPEAFVLYLPKDVVSGDFYWIEKEGNKIFIAAADCTGHGVPGAFMSIVGLDLLRNILSEGIKSPSEILNKLNIEFNRIFEHKTEQDEKVKDGMDISVCIIDKENKSLEFAGAKNPLYLIRNNSIIIFKADRYSIGPDDNKISETGFNSKYIELEPGDMLYIFSDGYADQFGGIEGRKFKHRRFRRVLLSIHKQELEKQKEILENTLRKWQNGIEQVDDILIIGFSPV